MRLLRPSLRLPIFNVGGEPWLFLTWCHPRVASPSHDPWFNSPAPQPWIHSHHLRFRSPHCHINHTPHSSQLMWPPWIPHWLSQSSCAYITIARNSQCTLGSINLQHQILPVFSNMLRLLTPSIESCQLLLPILTVMILVMAAPASFNLHYSLF